VPGRGFTLHGKGKKTFKENGKKGGKSNVDKKKRGGRSGKKGKVKNSEHCRWPKIPEAGGERIDSEQKVTAMSFKL